MTITRTSGYCDLIEALLAARDFGGETVDSSLDRRNTHALRLRALLCFAVLWFGLVVYFEVYRGERNRVVFLDRLSPVDIDRINVTVVGTDSVQSEL